MTDRESDTERIVREAKGSLMGESKPPVAPIPSTAPNPMSVWLHWKGKQVTVIGTGHHSETGELLVFYAYDGKFWGRPLAMWDDEARPGIQRFRLLALGLVKP